MKFFLRCKSQPDQDKKCAKYASVILPAATIDHFAVISRSWHIFVALLKIPHHDHPELHQSNFHEVWYACFKQLTQCNEKSSTLVTFLGRKKKKKGLVDN